MATVSAQESRGDFGVRLQPFSRSENSTDAPRAIRVAYYVPRAQAVPALRAQLTDEDESENEIAPAVTSNASRPLVRGNRAVLINGVAYAPSNAPMNIKNAIWAVNTLRHKPYVWGGGHGSFLDYGYDCSGAVSFALHYAGLLATPLPSNDLQNYGERGRGHWITIYARNGHTFAIIAGLRLDTSDLRGGGDVGPRWYADGRNARDFEARHAPGW